MPVPAGAVGAGVGVTAGVVPGTVGTSDTMDEDAPASQELMAVALVRPLIAEVALRAATLAVMGRVAEVDLGGYFVV